MIPECVLIPQGVIKVCADKAQAPNAEFPPEKKAELIAQRNAPGYLHGVVSSDYSQNILWQPVYSRGEMVGAIQTLRPTQPWGWGAVMVNAVPQELLGSADQFPLDDNGLVPVQFVYNHEHEVQVAYARHILANLQTVSEEKLPGENIPAGMPEAVAIENAVTVLGSGRTLATQHAQIVKPGMPAQEEENVRFAKELRLEQWVKRNFPYAEPYVHSVKRGMDEVLHTWGQASLAEGLQIFPRQQAKPFGYTVMTPITSDMSLDTQAAMYAPIMAAHYKIGAEQLTDYVQSLNGQLRPRLRDKIRPQYSSRQYTYFLPDSGDRKRLYVTFSPELLGGAALEDAGGYLRRHPEYTPPFGVDALEEYTERYKTKIQAKLAPFGKIYTARRAS